MARGGKREGAGKPAGQPNRATLEKRLAEAEEANRQLKAAQASGHKLAKDVLEEFMLLFRGMAAVYQPMAPGLPPRAGQDEKKFVQYAQLTVETAAQLAPFQSAKFKAIALMGGGLPTDSIRPGGGAKLIPGAEVIDLDDPKAVMRTYLSIVKGPAKAVG